MVRVLISYLKSANNKGRVCVKLSKCKSKYMKFLALDFREYTYLLGFSGNTRIP